MTHCGSLQDLFNPKHPGEGNDNINIYADMPAGERRCKTDAQEANDRVLTMGY